MPTSSEVRTVLKDAAALATRTVDQAAAMEVLLEKGEAGRTDRSESKPIEVLDVRLIDGRVAGKVQGVKAVYQPRITVFPRRAFSCTCPDSQRRGRKVGPCKHTLALARHWLDHLQPELERIQTALTQVLF